jgi:hypothetical protein
VIKGKPQTLRSPHQASCLGSACPEDRKTDGIIAAASVRENIVLALQAQRGWLRPIPGASKTPLPSALSASWDPYPERGTADRVSLRRQPAEGAALPLAADQTAVPDPR